MITKKVERICNSMNNHEKNIANDEIQQIFSALDEAIDDLENGRIISEEEMWKELDSI